MLHISPEITIYILTITFILGCCLGSFADCAAGRLLPESQWLPGGPTVTTAGMSWECWT